MNRLPHDEERALHDEEVDAIAAELAGEPDRFVTTLYDLDSNVPVDECIARQLFDLYCVPSKERGEALRKFHDALRCRIQSALWNEAEKEHARRRQAA